MNANEFWEYCQRPENEHRDLDLSRGRLIEWPRRSRLQSFLAAQVGFALGTYGHQQANGIATATCGVILGASHETVRGVDAAYFPLTMAEEKEDGWATTAPIVAVHILGSEESIPGMGDWCDDFLDNGTLLVWVVFPIRHCVQVSRSFTPHQILREGDVLEGMSELPCFSYKVSDFFRLPGQPAA